MSNKTKFDCPYYITKGGHCRKSKFSNKYVTSISGCTYPKDITKCPHYQKYQKEIKNNIFYEG